YRAPDLVEMLAPALEGLQLLAIEACSRLQVGVLMLARRDERIPLILIGKDDQAARQRECQRDDPNDAPARNAHLRERRSRYGDAYHRKTACVRSGRIGTALSRFPAAARCRWARRLRKAHRA